MLNKNAHKDTVDEAIRIYITNLACDPSEPKRVLFFSQTPTAPLYTTTTTTTTTETTTPTATTTIRPTRATYNSHKDLNSTTGGKCYQQKNNINKKNNNIHKTTQNCE